MFEQFPAVRTQLALRVVAALVGNASAMVATFGAELQRFEFTQTHMGVEFAITLYAPDEDSANQVSAAAFARIHELDTLLSDYDPQSELNLLSDTAGSGQRVPISKDLWAVLSQAQKLSVKTGGAFDVTVGPLSRLWRRARRSFILPTEKQLTRAKAAVGYKYLKLDRATQSAQLVRPKMRLDVGGNAKGYAADEALAVLARQGIAHAMVRASGDISVGEPPPDAKGWKIGIAPLEEDGPPRRFLLLARMAVSTSGDAHQFLEFGGKRYSHILDPHTGLGLTTRSSVTVIAPRGIDADGLASAVCVLGPERGLRLIEEMPDTAVLIVQVVDGQTETHESERFKKLAGE